ncbi:MAG: PASTA domain-containing protein [Bacteroidales bacterium]|nr:PASTA domain-containing protein [Bacteroidales bacterium]
MSFLGFLAKKNFYLHLLLSVILTVVIIMVMIGLMKSYTHHGEAYVIPELTGFELNQLEDAEFYRIFNYVVTDSVFDNELLPGSVIKQNPSAGSKAKAGRTIYVTIVSYNLERTFMPELKDLTVRQAITTLKSSGLKVRKLIYTPHFAQNSVLGQFYNDDTLFDGTDMLKGSEIDLLVGLGSSNITTRVPSVIGLTREQARDMLHMAFLNISQEVYHDQKNLLHSRVFRQFPGWETELPRGKSVILHYRSDLTFDFDSLLNIINATDTTIIRDTYILPDDLEDFDSE